MANLSRKLAAVQNKRGCFPFLVVFQVLRLVGVILRAKAVYSGLVESISGGSLAWAWPEVWAVTSTRGRPHEQAQGKGRKSHRCDTMSRARLSSRWPPFQHLPLNHVIRMLEGIECSCDFMNVWPCERFSMLIEDFRKKMIPWGSWES